MLEALETEELQTFYALDTHFIECDMVYKEFEKFCNIYGFKIYRQDKHGLIGDIKKQIFDEINKSQYLVADVTTKNPNVMLELGYAFQKLGKTRVIIFHKESTQQLPFDIFSQNAIFYDLGTNLERAQFELTNITERLLHWFRDANNRIGFTLKKDEKYEELFHFPIDTPNFQWWRWGEDRDTPGGQDINDFKNITICHDDKIGNFVPGHNTDPTDKKSSYMVLLSDGKTKGLRKGDKLHLRIRARFKNTSSCKFTFVCDGKEGITVDGKAVWFVIGHKWAQIPISPKSSAYQVIGEGNFDTIIEPKYKVNSGDPDWTPTDGYNISQHGLSIGLGTTIEHGEIEISEIILIRERG